MQPPRSFLEDIIDERIEMAPVEPATFDDLLASGWRLLGYAIIRHNFTSSRGQICQTIPLRIRLDSPLNFSKSQRRLLRRNADLDVRVGPIRITPEKNALFLRHAQRFQDRQPTSIFTFLHTAPSEVPVPGLEFAVFDKDRLLACSYIHVGEQAVSGTYCFYEPDIKGRSLGAFTILLELQLAQQLGKQFYYHGYCNNVPSEFDYKLNFNNLEAMDWKSGVWTPQPRVPIRCVS